MQYPRDSEVVKIPQPLYVVNVSKSEKREMLLLISDNFNSAATPRATHSLSSTQLDILYAIITNLSLCADKHF